MEPFGWLKALFQKDFSNSVWCTLDRWSLFVPKSVAFEGNENAFLFCHNWQLFFFQADITFATKICEFVHRKTFVLPIECCFWKKRLKNESWKKTKSLAAKKSRISEDFLDSPRKTGNFEGIVFFLCLVNEICRKSFPNNYRSVEAKFILSKETLKTVNEFAFCLLIGQIGSSFFLWKKCFASQLFFLVFKRTLLIELLQVRKMKVKAKMRQISFGQKK